MPDQKTTYPMVTVQRWWALRNRFRSSVPPKVTPAYLHSVLGISEKTARDVELPLLKRLGLVEPDGSTADRARRWRDDEQYPAVCAEIRDAVYPEELVHAVPDPANDEKAAIRWFMNATGAGEKAGQYMARTYRLLIEADSSGGSTSNDKPRAVPAKKSVQPRRERARSQQDQRKPALAAEPPVKEAAQLPVPVPASGPEQSRGPTLHIDIQIHIAADASAEQIDQIFASMAKHLYSRNGS